MCRKMTTGCQSLVTSLELAQALLVEELTAPPVFDTPTAVADYLKLHFAGQTHESFAVLFLDARHALLAFEDMFRGTLTQTSVYPREVLKRALHHNAAAVILAHFVARNKMCLLCPVFLCARGSGQGVQQVF